MPRGSVQYRTLQKALALAGSVERLAEIIGATTEEVAGWLDRKAEIPMPAFYDVVDFLLEHRQDFLMRMPGRTIKGEPPISGSEDT